MIAICSMVRNEARYLPEWLAFHRLQGVGLFRIYDDQSTDGTAELLARQIDVDLIPWGGDHFTRQAAAFEDAAEALALYADWCAFIDADEFLFGRHQRLPELMAAFLPEVGAVAVQQLVFGPGEDGNAPVVERCILRAADTYSEHAWFKTIARPERIIRFNTQHAVETNGDYVLSDGYPFTLAGQHPGCANRIAAADLRLHHYPLKSWPEFQTRKARGAVSDRGEFKRHVDAFYTSRIAATTAVMDETLLHHDRVTDLSDPPSL